MVWLADGTFGVQHSGYMKFQGLVCVNVRTLPVI